MLSTGRNRVGKGQNKRRCRFAQRLWTSSPTSTLSKIFPKKHLSDILVRSQVPQGPRDPQLLGGRTWDKFIPTVISNLYGSLSRVTPHESPRQWKGRGLGFPNNLLDSRSLPLAGII